MNIVFVAHSSFNENFVVGSHHLSRAMAAEGHTVWHIGPPVTPFHFLQASSRPSYRDRLRRSMLEPEMMDGLTSMEPMALVPWQIARRFLARGNLFVKTSNLVRRLRKVFAPGEIDILIIDDPRFAGLEQKLKPRALFYRLTDFYAEMKGDPTILEAERHLLARCAAVIATSQPVLQHALALHPGLPSLLLENGVDHAHFSTEVAEPEVLKAIPRPRVVYVGAIDFRFDVGLLDALAYRCPAMHFVMIGDGPLSGKIAELRRPNIHLLGPRPYREMPGYLQFSDVGLLPFVDNVVNSGRSPMKLYEYGAAGLPALARRTRELARREDRFVRLFSSEDEAVSELEMLIDRWPDRRAIAQDCRDHGWKQKSAALLEFISIWSDTNRRELPLSAS
jgi:glycosyltransferase involved in cell wall biosynthesis